MNTRGKEMERKQVWLEPEDIETIKYWADPSTPIEKVIEHLKTQLAVPPAEMPAGRELDERVCRYFGEHEVSDVHQCTAWSHQYGRLATLMAERLHERGIYVMAGYDSKGAGFATLMGSKGHAVGDTPSHAVARLIAALAQEEQG